MGPLAQLHELSKSTEERLTSLNALAEHVTHKAKALESQKHTIDHAVVEANRLNELVWSMDSQIAKLNEGNKQIAHTEENLARMEKLAAETTSQLESATQGEGRARARDCARREGRARPERFDPRARGEAHGREEGVRGLRSAPARAAGLGRRGRRAHGVARGEGQERDAAQPARRRAGRRGTRSCSRRATSSARSRRRSSRCRPGSTRSTTSPSGRTRSSWHSIRAAAISRRSRRRSSISTSRTPSAAQLRDKLGSDRAALEGFIERVTALNSRTPEIEAKMDAIQAKFGLIEEGTQKATRVGELASELDGQVEPRGGAAAVRRAGRSTYQRPQRRAGRCRAQARRSARAPRRSRHHQDADRHAGRAHRRRPEQARRGQRAAAQAAADDRTALDAALGRRKGVYAPQERAA